jgi:UDP-2,3-diacylglucosamine hydrolase
VKAIDITGHRTLVVADIHLMPTAESDQLAPPHPINQAFLAFLTGPAKEADQLIIMGDLFEVWLGDDVSMAFYPREIDALAQLSSQGTEIYIGLGNRDFLIGHELLKACQAKGIFDDIIALEHKQKPAILLMHGDSLCTDDKAYQRMRFWLQKVWIKGLLRRLPKSWRLKLAQQLREKSTKANQQKNSTIMDVTDEALKQLWQTFPESSHLIHGHTHRPGHQHYATQKHRWVLGDWYEGGASYITIDNGQPSLEKFYYPV